MLDFKNKSLRDYSLNDLYKIQQKIRIQTEEKMIKKRIRIMKNGYLISFLSIISLFVFENDLDYFIPIIVIFLIIGPLLLVRLYDKLFKKSLLEKELFQIEGMIETKRRIITEEERLELRKMCILQGEKVHPLVYAEIMNTPGVREAYLKLNEAEAYNKGFKDGIDIMKKYYP